MNIHVDCLGKVNVEAIGYTLMENGCTVLHKFGTVDFVEKWAQSTRRTYIQAGLDDIAKEVQTIYVENLPKEEVEKMLNICDYIGTYLKRYKDNNYV